MGQSPSRAVIRYVILVETVVKSDSEAHERKHTSREPPIYAQRHEDFLGILSYHAKAGEHSQTMDT